MTKQARLYVIGAATIAILVIAMVVLHSNSSMTMSSTATSAADTASAVSTNKVAIKDYMFAPMAIKVKVGTTVTWTNQDEVHHSVTADQASAAAPNSPLFGKGESYSFKFTKAGTYTFHCMPHPYMHGTVIVTN